MTGNVVDFQAVKAEREPHCVGRARCLDCKREWEAVAPTGTRWLECPACTLIRGRFVAQHERDEPHWHCLCGNELFHVVKDGYYCPNCGEAQYGF